MAAVSGYDHRTGFQACCTASRRLCGITPAITMTLIVCIAVSTVFHGWVIPVGHFWEHGRIELAIFSLEVICLVTSYLTAVLRGPGFVPLGWKPTEEELARLLKSVEGKDLPLDTEEIPVNDLLQWCPICNGYKPPRAHHCSNCSRCVLSMDHHCPWTNTCVGQINLKAFVQFVHFVPLATFHSVAIHSELFALLIYAWQRARKNADFFKVLLQLQVLLGLLAWFAALVVMLLVGTLAWEMQHTVRTNMTMIEEYVIEKAEVRRRRNGEKKFVFPYDLGKGGNKAAVLGSGRFSWLIPGGATPGDPVWPSVRAGSTHFDLSMEQIAQKTEKLQRSLVMPVRQAFSAAGRCCCTYWCWVGWHFGCALCDCEACGEQRLSVAVGEAVLVSKSEGSWAHGRLMAGSQNGNDCCTPLQPGGWLPRQCLNERFVQPYQIPFQKELQGRWEVLQVDNRVVVVKGLVVHTANSRLSFSLREEDGAVRLLGSSLKSCDGQLAQWSNGQVWKKQDQSPSLGGEWPQDEEFIDLPRLEEMKKDA